MLVHELFKGFIPKYLQHVFCNVALDGFSILFEVAYLSRTSWQTSER